MEENGKITEEKVKSRASRIIDGEIEPEPNERYLLNLRKRKPFNEWDKEKLREICRQGQKAQREIYGRKKTAKEALQDILSLKITDDIVKVADIDTVIVDRLRRSNPEATFYDLIQLVAVGKALDGSVNAMVYVRDTNGDKPKDQLEIESNIMTDQDRDLLKRITERMEDGDRLEIVREITTDNGKDQGTDQDLH